MQLWKIYFVFSSMYLLSAYYVPVTIARPGFQHLMPSDSFCPPLREKLGLAHFKDRDAEEQQVNETAWSQHVTAEKGDNPGLLDSWLGIVNPHNVLPSFMILV